MSTRPALSSFALLLEPASHYHCLTMSLITISCIHAVLNQ